MPDPPSVSIITRWLFDNPWPVAVALAVVAIALVVAAHRAARRDLLIGAVIALLLIVLVFVVESAVVTSGERAATITTELVEAAENADVNRAHALFSDDAIMSLVRPTNPGVGIDTIRRRLDMLESRYRVESARITSLDTYSVSTDHGVAHLRVTAELGGAYGYATPSAWVIEVRRSAAGEWEITHITFVEYNLGQTPGPGLF